MFPEHEQPVMLMISRSVVTVKHQMKRLIKRVIGGWI